MMPISPEKPLTTRTMEKHHRSVLKWLVAAGGRLDLRDQNGTCVKDIVRPHFDLAGWERPRRPDENKSMALENTLLWIQEMLE